MTRPRRELPDPADGQEIAAEAKAEGYALPQVTVQVMNTVFNHFDLPTLGAPDYSYGKWDLSTGPSGVAGGGDHTLISDARFVYRDGTKPSPDNGQAGTHLPVFDGQRFSVGQRPTSRPALFTS